MRTLFRLAWATPFGKVVIILIVIAAIALWIWTQVEESKTGDKLREKDRERNDSIWKD